MDRTTDQESDTPDVVREAGEFPDPVDDPDGAADDPGAEEPDDGPPDPDAAVLPTAIALRRLTVGALPDLGPPKFRERPRRRRRRSRRRRVVGYFLVTSGALLLVSSAWIGWRAFEVYRNLDAASAALTSAVDTVTDSWSDGAAGAPELLQRALQSTSAAVSAADDPLYSLATHLPWIGPNLDAAGEMARGVDDLLRVADRELPALLDRVGPTGQGLDGPAVAELVVLAAPAVDELSAATDRATARLAGTDHTGLLGPVEQGLTDLTARLDLLRTELGTLDGMVEVVDLVIGASQDSRILIGIQNSAEMRATGGIVGSYVVLNAKAGEFEIAAQGSTSRDWAAFGEPVVDVPADLAALFGQLPAQHPQDVNLTPDFPTAASMLSRMYAAEGGGEVDAVIALDPAVLSRLLPSGRGFDLGGDITVEADGLARLLLAGIYDRFPATADQPARDDFLAGAVGALMRVVVEGPVDLQQLGAGMSEMLDEHRVLLWASDPRVQQVVASTAVSGAVEGGTDIGVYLNDATGSKLGFHQYHSVRVTPGSCRADGRREYTVTVGLEFRSPGKVLPDYVLGSTRSDADPALTTSVMVMAPAGGEVVSRVVVDGGARGVQRGELGGRGLALTTVSLRAGESTEISWTVVGSAQATGSPSLRLTPTAHPWAAKTEAAPSC